jgi:hypothetical protein
VLPLVLIVVGVPLVAAVAGWLLAAASPCHRPEPPSSNGRFIMALVR